MPVSFQQQLLEKTVYRYVLSHVELRFDKVSKNFFLYPRIPLKLEQAKRPCALDTDKLCCLQFLLACCEKLKACPQTGTQDPVTRTQDQDLGPRTQDHYQRTQDPGPRTLERGPRTQDLRSPPFSLGSWVLVPDLILKILIPIFYGTQIFIFFRVWGLNPRPFVSKSINLSTMLPKHACQQNLIIF